MRGRIAIALAALLALAAARTRAHEGHDDAPGAQSAAGAERYEVLVSPEARRNLELEVAAAELRPIESVLPLTGEIVALPARSGTVASRIAGRVISVLVAEGDRVKAGQPVVVVESLLLGDPPPRATYSAPLGGVVIDRHVVPGDAVEPNVHLLEVADLAEVLAVGRVFEGQVARVRAGQTARVRTPAFPDRVFEGVVERLGGQLDAGSRSASVYVRLANSDGLLRPHMQASISLVVAETTAALAVPRSALLGEFGSLFLFVENDRDPTRFERRPVAKGASDDRYVEILDGIVPGERVVTEGGYQLQFLPPAESAAEAQSTHDDAATPESASSSDSSFLAWIVGGALGGAALGFAAFSIGLRRTRQGA